MLVLVGLVGGSLAWGGGGYKLNLDYKNLAFDPNLVDVQLDLKKGDGSNLVNLRCEVKQEVTDNLILHIQYFKKINEEYVHYTNVSMSFCNVFRRSREQSICPIPKGVYTVKDKMLSGDMIPPFIPLPSGTFKLIARINRVVGGDQIPAVKLTLFVDFQRKNNEGGGGGDRPPMMGIGERFKMMRQNPDQ